MLSGIFSSLALCLCVAEASDIVTLRAAAAEKGIFFGTAVNAGHLKTDSAYKSLAQKQYNLVTAENACKWSMEYKQGQFNFQQCDEIRDFTLTEMNGTFRGHNLCWGKYNPGWLKSLNGDGKRSALVHHIQEVAKHYGSDAFAWDVVNEAVTDNRNAKDPLKSNDWYPDVPDYIDVAFKTARAAFPQGVKLFYNDYGIADTNAQAVKSDRVYNLLKDALNRSVPIDGVGFQMHIKSSFTDFAGVKANMERLGALGLDVHITELDISFDSWSESAEQDQAGMYANILQVCLDVKACKSFETWGLTDKYTWKGTDKHPLPFDEDYKPKAAVASMLAAMNASSTPVEHPAVIVV